MRSIRALPAAAMALAALAATATPPAAAHDFWIEPSTYAPRPGERVALRLRVGEHFLGDPLPRDERLLRRFVAADAAGVRPVAGVDGADPAGFVATNGAGTLVIGYESGPSLAELDATMMALYVDQEGLASQLGDRASWRRLPRVRDRFSRSAKSLLRIGDRTADREPAAYDRVLGLPLELVPATDPATLAGGGELALRLLWRGRPAAGLRVTAIPRLAPTRTVAATTDREGRVTLGLDRGGVWLLKAVRIAPAPAESATAAKRNGGAADYISEWTSLTLELPPAPERAR